MQIFLSLSRTFQPSHKQPVKAGFHSAGINTEVQHAAITDSDDPFKDLQESLDALKAADPDMVPEDISAESIGDVDNDVIATAPVITDDDILEQFQKDHSPESGEEDGCDDESLNDEVPELNDLQDQKWSLLLMSLRMLPCSATQEKRCDALFLNLKTCLQRNA